MPLNRIAVVGASLAGLRVAQALRRHGYDGALTVIGEEPHPPYDRPPLSKSFLTSDAPAPTLLRESDAALDIEWRTGTRATALDLHAREVALASGERVAFDACAITTGAAAKQIPLSRTPMAGIFVLRTLDDALALRRALHGSPRVAVIGGGFIGAEVAATCRARGLDVTIVEALPALLERGLGRRMGAYFAQLHSDHGVALRLGTGVREFLGGARVEGLRLSDGSTVASDVVVVGVGATPNTGWLESSGLELDDGVLCDASCRATRAPFVVAAGDVARWPNQRFGEVMRVEHWTNATEQADHAATTLLANASAVDNGTNKIPAHAGDGDGGDARDDAHAGDAHAATTNQNTTPTVAPFVPVPFVWSEQFEYRLQFAGLMRAGDESAVVDGSLDARRFVMLFARRGRLCGVLGVNRPRLVMKYRALIRAGAAWDLPSLTRA